MTPTAPAPAPAAIATCRSRTFRLEHAVSVAIRATPAKIWSLLTNAAEFPRWNSTVTKIAGTIAVGEPLAIEAKAAPGRTFKVRVAELAPEQSMVWRAGFFPMFQGVRTFTLTPGAAGTTAFSMIEVFRGAMLPMIRGSLPDFGPMFVSYANDLKREAERA